MSGEIDRVCLPLKDPRQVVACEEVARVCEGEPNGDDGGYLLQFREGSARPPDRESCYRVARTAGRSEWKLLPRGSEDLFRTPSPNDSAAAVVTLTSVEQVKSGILSSDEPAWVIIGASYCHPCHINRARMAKANEDGGMKAKIAYIDYDAGEGVEIIKALGLRELFNAIRTVPKLFYLGSGKGEAKIKSAKSLSDLYPKRFKGVDAKKDKAAYQHIYWKIWDEIIERITGGGNGR